MDHIVRYGLGSRIGRSATPVAVGNCGRLGKVTNCQAVMFVAYVSLLGRALVDKRLYLPGSWTSDAGAVQRRGCLGSAGAIARSLS